MLHKNYIDNLQRSFTRHAAQRDQSRSSSTGDWRKNRTEQKKNFLPQQRSSRCGNQCVWGFSKQQKENWERELKELKKLCSQQSMLCRRVGRATKKLFFLLSCFSRSLIDFHVGFMISILQRCDRMEAWSWAENKVEVYWRWRELLRHAVDGF